MVDVVVTGVGVGVGTRVEDVVGVGEGVDVGVCDGDGVTRSSRYVIEMSSMAMSPLILSTSLEAVKDTRTVPAGITTEPNLQSVSLSDTGNKIMT